jgi:hypothetical protein
MQNRTLGPYLAASLPSIRRLRLAALLSAFPPDPICLSASLPARPPARVPGWVRLSVCPPASCLRWRTSIDARCSADLGEAAMAPSAFHTPASPATWLAKQGTPYFNLTPARAPKKRLQPDTSSAALGGWGGSGQTDAPEAHLPETRTTPLLQTPHLHVRIPGLEPPTYCHTDRQTESRGSNRTSPSLCQRRPQTSCCHTHTLQSARLAYCHTDTPTH